MPIMQVTAADIAKGQNLEPGNYAIKLIAVLPPKASKAGTTMNYVFRFLVKGEKAKGKEIDHLVNSTMLYQIQPMFDALMYPEKFVPGQFDTDVMLEKECDAIIGNRPFEGRLIDDIQNFVPSGMGVHFKPVF